MCIFAGIFLKSSVTSSFSVTLLDEFGLLLWTGWCFLPGLLLSDTYGRTDRFPVSIVRFESSGTSLSKRLFGSYGVGAIRGSSTRNQSQRRISFSELCSFLTSGLIIFASFARFFFVGYSFVSLLVVFFVILRPSLAWWGIFFLYFAVIIIP